MAYRGLTRRDLLLGAGAAAGALAAFEALSPARVLERVLASPAKCGRLSDIKHVVIFINENRSFDSYFGTYRGVRGFADPEVLELTDGSGKTIFSQPFPPKKEGESQELKELRERYGGYLLPFHFDTTKQGECVNDISHEWAQMHQCWHGGALDSFLSVHVDPAVNGTKAGPNTMGYYTRDDLPFFHSLADNFTICDAYHCSLLGPTDPNRLFSMSAKIDLSAMGGPSLETQVKNRQKYYGTFNWRTYPEQLQAAGISWKIYSTPDGDYGDNVLHYFQAYEQNPEHKNTEREPDPVLHANAFTSQFPANFKADCEAGTLPQVSWVLGSLVDSEHPPAPVTYGEVVLSEILGALVSNPALWSNTAVFATYDENGGFFDHVKPLTAPEGTPGEYLTVTPPAKYGGIRGPLGLGFRVPMLVISPFSRGGLVCSDRFDHTSLLRFLERRFGPEVHNLSKWRREVTGDLTSAFNFAAPADQSVPPLPKPVRSDPRVLPPNDCPTQAPEVGEQFATVKYYELPKPPQTMPGQEEGAPRRPSGC